MQIYEIYFYYSLSGYKGQNENSKSVEIGKAVKMQ